MGMGLVSRHSWALPWLFGIGFGVDASLGREVIPKGIMVGAYGSAV